MSTSTHTITVNCNDFITSIKSASEFCDNDAYHGLDSVAIFSKEGMLRISALNGHQMFVSDIEIKDGTLPEIEVVKNNGRGFLIPEHLITDICKIFNKSRALMDITITDDGETFQTYTVTFNANGMAYNFNYKPQNYFPEIDVILSRIDIEKNNLNTGEYTTNQVLFHPSILPILSKAFNFVIKDKSIQDKTINFAISDSMLIFDHKPTNTRVITMCCMPVEYTEEEKDAA